MTTPRIRSLVSLAAALTFTLTLGGCVSAPSRLAVDESPFTEGPIAFRFDNDAVTYVHVYLVSDQRQWLLGRVEPGAHTTLRIPEDAMAGNVGSMRLAVLAGQPVSLRAASNARAAITIVRPMAELLSLRWTFSQALAVGQLTPRTLARDKSTDPAQR